MIPRAHPDSQDPQAATDYLADLAYPAHPARLANPVKMASRARLDPPERRVSRDLRVPWDRKDHQARLVFSNKIRTLCAH